jgi:FAS-associated factor 2
MLRSSRSGVFPCLPLKLAITKFCSVTLTDPTFVSILYENNILVWGGDVRDHEAWSGKGPITLANTSLTSCIAAQKLQATTYPFISFVALQPRRIPAAVSHSPLPSPILTILSRHCGPSTPSTAPTSPSTLSTHLTSQLLPRITPSLTRIHATHLQRERDRRLREEQDCAFQESARRDRERIEARRAAELQESENKRQRDELERYQVEKLAREAEEKLFRETQRMEWRRWARKSLVLPDTFIGGLRIAIRLPSSPLVVHRFPRSSTLTSLFTFIDTHLIPPHFSPSSDPSSPPLHTPPSHPSTESTIDAQILLLSSPETWWGFKLMLVYPRREVYWKPNKLIADIEDLREGGQVIVEMINGHSSSDRSLEKVDDDGYSTEESD